MPTTTGPETIRTLSTVLAALRKARMGFDNPYRAPEILVHGDATRVKRCKDVVNGLADLGAIARSVSGKVEDAYVSSCLYCIAFHDYCDGLAESKPIEPARVQTVADLDIAIRAIEDAIYVRTPGRHVSAAQDAAEGASLARMAPLGGE
jgi:hypothetical protein